MEQSNTNNSILDIILEKASNSEQASNTTMIRTTLNDSIKLLAKREKALRESTIMIKKINETTPLNEVSDMIEKEWVEGKKQPPATYWQNKSSTFVQFINQEAKNKFLDFAALNLATEFKDRIQKPNSAGEHIDRNPIRIEINNVRGNIKADRIEEILKRVIDNKGKVTEFREGKPHPATSSRNIMFKIDSQAFKTLFGTMDGGLPYVNLATGTKTKLFLKINCKPWNCRECYAFGQHQCEGKLCGQCGVSGHLTKDCKQKTKYCKNCKRRGHKAKDTHCPMYLGEIAKELRKIEIPIEYLEDKELRFNLIKHLQLK